MDGASTIGGWVTRVNRVWLLGPFQKQLQKRQREATLLAQLSDCVDLLYRDPRQPGLNLETLHTPNKQPVLSARIDKSHRLIMTPLERGDIGLIYFDNHDESYEWVRRQGSRLGTMLSKQQEMLRGTRFEAGSPLVAVVRADEDSPIAIASAAQFHAMVEQGVARYLTYLDEEQKRLAEIKTNGLLLVKGGAGTGKTAVAVHRLVNLARQPTLIGPTRVLFLCFNSVLSGVVLQLVDAVANGHRPKDIEVRTFHAWCLGILRPLGVVAPTQVHEDGCEQAVFAAYAHLAPDRRTLLGDLQGEFLRDEIIHVIKHNGLKSQDQYLAFNRQGRRVPLKQVQRQVVWEAHEDAERHRLAHGVYDWNDLPLIALDALDAMPHPPQYRAVIVDEGQDCTPVMMRLAKRLLAESHGPITVFADPAQAIYEHGFHWTQQELKPAGGNVRWLRKNYRCTREVYDLARPLLDGHSELSEELAQMQPPDRRGDKPILLMDESREELLADIADRVARAVEERPVAQVAVLGTHRLLKLVAELLRSRAVPTQGVDRGRIHLEDASVKLMTQQAAKGLDFPLVFVLPAEPRANAPAGELLAPEARRTLYVALTRSSERLVVGARYSSRHPLLDLLPPDAYTLEGSRAREFAGTRGVAFPT